MTLTPPVSDGQRAGADFGITAFLAEQVGALGELDLVAVSLADPPHAVEVNSDGATTAGSTIGVTTTTPPGGGPELASRELHSLHIRRASTVDRRSAISLR
jgi:hypothetical protein